MTFLQLSCIANAAFLCAANAELVYEHGKFVVCCRWSQISRAQGDGPGGGEEQRMEKRLCGEVGCF